MDKREWARLRELADGQKWSKTYLDDMYRGAVADRPGVYVICASLRLPPQSLAVGPFSKLYNVVYAGRSTNLRSRFRQHVTGTGEVPRAKAAFGLLEFWFLELPTDQIATAEQALIAVFGPPCNVINATSIAAKIGQPERVGR